MSGWIGVDLDGVLAHFVGVAVWDGGIGAPVPKMVERVKAWVEAGEDVRIFTARVATYDFDDGGDDDARSEPEQRKAIQAWCREHLGYELPITCRKDYGMQILYDDRAVQVVVNTGELVGE